MGDQVVPNLDDFILIKAINADSNEVHFRVKPYMQMKRVRQSYADHKRIPIETVRFSWRDREIDDEDTPASIGIQNGDYIRVFIME